MAYAVYVEEMVEMGYDRPDELDYVKKGVRKTLKGAITLAEQYIGTIYGTLPVKGGKPGDLQVSNGSKRAQIRKGHYFT